VSEMVARAAAAASNAWHECDTCPGEMYVKEARIIARAALLAALDLAEQEQAAIFDGDDNHEAQVFNEGARAMLQALKDRAQGGQ